jgi:RNA polymerase sigma factor (sigma-70 family)
MEQHERLIHAFIRRQGGGVIGYEEALQAGRIGLWRAIRGYDAKRGTAFSTYAWVAICRQIQRRDKEVRREREINCTTWWSSFLSGYDGSSCVGMGWEIKSPAR